MAIYNFFQLTDNKFTLDADVCVKVKSTLINMKKYVISELNRINFKSEMEKIGLKYEKISYNIVISYNYNNFSSIDIHISVTDIDKLINAMSKHENEINELLAKNKSYDGYISLTPVNFANAIYELKEKKEIDIISLSVIIRDILKSNNAVDEEDLRDCAEYYTRC